MKEKLEVSVLKDQRKKRSAIDFRSHDKIFPLPKMVFLSNITLKKVRYCGDNTSYPLLNSFHVKNKVFSVNFVVTKE